MANPTSLPPSFSPRRKWSIAINVVLATAAVLAVLAGLNYVSNKYVHKRFHLSSETQITLSPRTTSLLHSLTNQVDVTIYYNKEEPLYGDIVNLLKEYQAQTRKLTVKTVDYYDPGAAEEFKLKYNLGSRTNRDFVVFDCEGRKAFVDGNWLSTYQYNLEPSTNSDDSRLYLNRKRTAFNGEILFTSKLFAVTQAKPLKAYFLQGHGERSPTDTSPNDGYSKMADVFGRNYVLVDTLNNLFGTNTVPLDCNLLVIAGPQQELQQAELDKIAQYLDQGGRLFALFDVSTAEHKIGLETVLAKWNVRVTHAVVHDPSYALDEGGKVFAVPALALHEVTKPLLGMQLDLALPRPIQRLKAPQGAADEVKVSELAFSSTNSTLENSTSPPGQYPLMVAVEKNAAKGVVTERGTTRMLITGDALFLDNQLIDVGANQDFAESAVNWLLDRTIFLSGIGPRPVTEYRLLMNKNQVGTVKCILLGAIPGAVLLFGGLVWLRRRK
jgi:hypothetical protein